MKILLADDETAARYGMSRALQGAGREILEASDGNEALALIREKALDLVFLDINMPKCDGLAVLTNLQETPVAPMPEIVVVTANDSISLAVDCIRRGAADFLTKPFDVDHLRAIVKRSEDRLRLQHQVDTLRQQLSESGATFGAIRGSSRPMQRLFTQIERSARTDLPVLIRGESGTGKELIARELHQRSSRASKPFVAVNTAAVSENLVESELFGHIKGAFTGADRAREGVFRRADGGTLFLDEIGDMPASVQTRLLRVLQEGIVQPVGSEDGIRVNVRVISATHQDLEQAITDKAFRHDLYFRLKGIELTVPPLRERQEDILLLANSFLPSNRVFSQCAVAALMAYRWPGNVRELQQMIASAAALAEGERIAARDLGLAAALPTSPANSWEPYLDLPLSEARDRVTEDFERAAIGHALEQESGNISAAARRLGIHRQSLQQKLRQLGITTKNGE
ncbi:MAG: sigma-54 dependent transcriptional regulator [Planctomycetaceae bacterium]